MFLRLPIYKICHIEIEYQRMQYLHRAPASAVASISAHFGSLDAIVGAPVDRVFDASFRAQGLKGKQESGKVFDLTGQPS